MEFGRDTELMAGYKVIAFIWSVILISIAPYLLICHRIGLDGVQHLERIDILRNAFAILAGGLVLVTYYLRRRYHRIPRLRSRTHADLSSNQRAIQLYRNVTMVSVVLLEAISILGLVLFFLGAGFLVLYSFLGLAGLSMIYLRPRFSELESLARFLDRD